MGKNNWELSENLKTKRWYLTIPAGADTYPSIDDIKNLAISKSIDSYSLLSDQLLERAIKRAQDCAGEDYSFPIVLEPTFDVRINISQDKTSASLYIRKAADRKIPLDFKLVSTAINNSHLKGLDAVKVKEELTRFRDSPSLELKDFVIASGTPAGRGPQRELVALCEWIPEEEKTAVLPKLVEYYASLPATNDDKIFPIDETTKIARVDTKQTVFALSFAEQGTAGIDVYGKEIPGMPGNDPFFQTSGSITVGSQGIKSETKGLLLFTEQASCQKLRLVQYVDGKATPVISEDQMTVSLILESDEGAGELLSATAALDTLAKQGIQGKIDKELIGTTITRVRSTKKSEEIIIVRGKAPVPKGSSRITWFTTNNVGSSPITITSGDRILSAETLPSGDNGYDIYGTVLKAETGESAIVPEHDDTIAEETEGAIHTYTAKISGNLVLADNKLSISDTREITGDIDETTGDLHFPGNIALTGTIKAGRIVKAAGTLKIDGDSEASLVSADTTVSMTGGIRGEGRGTVWAKHEIFMAFAENARILAGQDISINDYCFQCTVKTNGTLFMKGNPAVLLGGTIHASKGVEVYELGSEKTIRTSISFGQNYLVSDQINVCEKEVEKIREEVFKIDEMMKRISTTDPKIHELRRKKLELLKKNDKLTVRIFTLKEQYETHIISHIRVENIVYPGVILESHGRYFEVREQKTHVIFIFDQSTGQITCNPIDTQEK